MTLRQPALFRTIAAGSVAGLAVSSAVLVGTTAPASAVPITFTCTTLLGDMDFVTDLSATPTTVPVGGQVTPTVTAVMNIPEGLSDTMRSLGVAKTSGTVTAPLSVADQARVRELVIPESAVPASGAIPLRAKGTLGAVQGTAVGAVIPVATQGPTVVMNLLNADGGAALDPQTVPCVTSTGEPVAAGQITVVKATSKSKATSTYAKRTKKATVKDKLTTNGAKATGKVTFVVKLGSKKVSSKTIAIKSSVAKTTFKLTKKGKYVITASYPGSAKVKGSKATTTLRVR